MDPQSVFRSVSPQQQGVGTTKDRTGAMLPKEEATQDQWDGVPTNKNPSGTNRLNAYRQLSNISMIIIQKCMLKYHVACLGIECLQIPTQLLAGRLLRTLSAELADHYTGPVGPKCNPGLSDRLPIQTPSGINAIPSHMTPEQLQLVTEEVAELIQKGAIEEVLNPTTGFYSNLFLVPKKDGGNGL